MRGLTIALGSAILAVALVACSGGKDKQRYSRDGVRRPADICAVDPRRFAEAEKIRDFDNGNGCGITNAWRIHAVNAVALSQPALVNCNMANVFSSWMTGSVQPAAEDFFGERVVAVDVAASYSCRPRNGKHGAKLSEHGMGNAIDISGFVLESGRRVPVEKKWLGGGRERKFLKEIRQDACGPFDTVLGPGADSKHKDHLHLDLERHRSGGAYCR